MKEDKGLLQLPATLVGARARAHYWTFAFDTQELVPPEHIALLAILHQKTGWLSFAVRQLEPTDLVNLPEVKADARKSQAERLASVLYVIWEQDHRGHPSFNTFYDMEMGKIIEDKKLEIRREL